MYFFISLYFLLLLYLIEYLEFEVEVQYYLCGLMFIFVYVLFVKNVFMCNIVLDNYVVVKMVVLNWFKLNMLKVEICYMIYFCLRVYYIFCQ